MATTLVYPRDVLDKEKHPATMRFGFFERDSAYRSTAIDEIFLYMPETAANPSTVSWDTEKFGFIGNAIAKAFRGSGGGSAGADFNWEGAIGGITDTISSGAEMGLYRALGVAGSNAAALMGGNVTAEGLIGEVTGKIPNPYLTMVFRGVDFRTFSFSFKFTPFSEDDCIVIDKIIDTFRKHHLPEKDGGYFKYPKECEISYHWRGQENRWLHQFKRAVCTALDVDYTPNGMFSPMRNGFPSSIVLNTKWSEVELITADDIKVGESPASNGGGAF